VHQHFVSLRNNSNCGAQDDASVNHGPIERGPILLRTPRRRLRHPLPEVIRPTWRSGGLERALPAEHRDFLATFPAPSARGTRHDASLAFLRALADLIANRVMYARRRYSARFNLSDAGRIRSGSTSTMNR
jgi:hypothetical protein